MRIWMMGLAILVGGAATGRAIDYNCPEEIQTDQTIKQTPSGWEPFNKSSRHGLDYVDFYSGPPQEMAQLKPDNGDSHEPPRWTFTRTKGRSIWEVCAYTDTKVTVVRKIPDTLKSCRVIYGDPNEGRIHGHALIRSVNCEWITP